MLLTSVIGHKISRDGMTSARPESIAFTAIIPRLPSNHRISQRRELVLQKKLCLSCTGSLGKTFEPISPLGRRVSDLVMDRKKSGLNVDSRSCETLSYKQSIAFVAIEQRSNGIPAELEPQIGVSSIVRPTETLTSEYSAYPSRKVGAEAPDLVLAFENKRSG